MERDEARQSGRTLDHEGMPDHQGPLPEKAATGDPQEGLAPPNEGPRASVDYGTTPEEELRGESLDDRLAREAPDVGDADAETSEDTAVEAVDPQGTLDDAEKDLVAQELPREGAPGSEERATRVDDELA